MADIIAFPQDDHRRHTVLIVDDEPVIRSFLCDYLNEAGFHALAVASGDEAARLLGQGVAIDLVFSDVRMPGTLDGFGLARWVTENKPGLPVLLASGDLGSKRDAAKACHGAEILPKPYDFHLVVRKICGAIEGCVQRSA